MQAREETNARKEPIDAGEAVALARKASRLVAVRGRKSTVVRPGTDGMTDAELSALVVGPSGKLRAPAIRYGKSVMVGFNEETWAAELI